MSTAYHALISGLFFGAGALAACRFTALHYQSRLNEATASAALYKVWWERDSGKMLIAQAQLDLIHQQHVDAGRKAHEPWRALRRETTEKLMQCVADRHETSPLAANPAAGDPAGAQRPQKVGGSGRETPRHAGQDTGAGILPDVTPRASGRNKPVDPCRRNRAGHFAPAEHPQPKGA